MMLASLAGPGEKHGPADAHDAGLFGRPWEKIVRLMLMMLASLAGPGKNTVRLMLMMLAWLDGPGEKHGPADAHDAGLFGRPWEKTWSG